MTTENMNRMQRAKIIVDGDVQGVGYRNSVRKIARKLKIVGTVKNLEDGTVEIICEGEEETLGAFIKNIEIKTPPIDVETIKTTVEEPTGEFKVFKIIEGDLAHEMREGFDTGMTYMALMNKNLGEKIDGVGEKVDAGNKMLAEKMDKVGEKVDKVGEKVDKLDTNTQKSFGIMDVKYGKISENMEKLAERLKPLEKLAEFAELFLAEKKKKKSKA